jgi:hypothetical protein
LEIKPGFLIAAAAFYLTASPAWAQFTVPTPSHEDYHVEVGATFWTPKPDVVMRFKAAGPDIDLIGLFEIDEERFTDFHAIIKPARKHKIRVQHVKVSYDEEKTFPATGPALADFTWDVWRLGYEWDVVSGAGGFLGVIGELKTNHITTSIGRTPDSAAAAADHNAPVPSVGGIVRGYVSKDASLTAEGTRFRLSRGGRHAEFVDYDLYGTFNLGRHLAVRAGFRSMTIDYAIDDDAGTLKMKGPYWGGTIRF